MFGFVKQIFISAMMLSSCNLPSVSSLSATLLKCILMTNQECKVRPQMVNVNNEGPVFSPFSIKVSKCNGSRNNINNLYIKLCVPDVAKS